MNAPRMTGTKIHDGYVAANAQKNASCKEIILKAVRPQVAGVFVVNSRRKEAKRTELANLHYIHAGSICGNVAQIRETRAT